MNEYHIWQYSLANHNTSFYKLWFIMDINCTINIKINKIPSKAKISKLISLQFHTFMKNNNICTIQSKYKAHGWYYYWKPHTSSTCTLPSILQNFLNFVTKYKLKFHWMRPKLKLILPKMDKVRSAFPHQKPLTPEPLT